MRVSEIGYVYRPTQAPETIPGVPRFAYPARANDRRYYPPKKPKRDPAFVCPPINPHGMTFTVDPDGEMATIGRARVPMRIGERWLVGPGVKHSGKDNFKVIIACSCGRFNAITLTAWRFCITHGTRACRDCQLKDGRDINAGLFVKEEPHYQPQTDKA